LRNRSGGLVDFSGQLSPHPSLDGIRVRRPQPAVSPIFQERDQRGLIRGNVRGSIGQQHRSCQLPFKVRVSSVAAVACQLVNVSLTTWKAAPRFSEPTSDGWRQTSPEAQDAGFPPAGEWHRVAPENAPRSNGCVDCAVEATLSTLKRAPPSLVRQYKQIRHQVIHILAGKAVGRHDASRR